MTSSITTKFVAAAALALAALGATSAAHARSDVYFSIGIPAPVYVQPRPVYVQPQPVYVQPQPVYVQPRSVYVQPTYGYGYVYENGRDWRREEWQRRHWQEQHRGWDQSRGRGWDGR